MLTTDTILRTIFRYIQAPAATNGAGGSGGTPECAKLLWRLTDVTMTAESHTKQDY